MTHDIKSGEGIATVVIESITAVGPITNRVSQQVRDTLFPQAAEVWCFSFWMGGVQLPAFFPDDQASAILERARLVESMKKVRSMQDANVFAESMKQTLEPPG